MILEAPLPRVATTVLLPDPVFNDSRNRQNIFTVKRAIDGTRYTYIHTTDERQRLLYQVRLARMKALELRAFIRSYFSASWRLTNHKGEVWRVWLVNNPSEFETAERAGGWPGNELVTLTLEFEGFLISSPDPPSC